MVLNLAGPTNHTVEKFFFCQIGRAGVAARSICFDTEHCKHPLQARQLSLISFGAVDLAPKACKHAQDKTRWSGSLPSYRLCSERT